VARFVWLVKLRQQKHSTCAALSSFCPAVSGPISFDSGHVSPGTNE